MDPHLPANLLVEALTLDVADPKPSEAQDIYSFAIASVYNSANVCFRYVCVCGIVCGWACYLALFPPTLPLTPFLSRFLGSLPRSHSLCLLPFSPSVPCPSPLAVPSEVRLASSTLASYHLLFAPFPLFSLRLPLSCSVCAENCRASSHTNKPVHTQGGPY